MGFNKWQATQTARVAALAEACFGMRSVGLCSFAADASGSFRCCLAAGAKLAGDGLCVRFMAAEAEIFDRKLLVLAGALFRI